MNKNLPERAYANMPSTGELILIKRGEVGYYPEPDLEDVSAAIMNDIIGVSKAEAEAMLCGSLFGWDVPGANPELYVEVGNKMKIKSKALDRLVKRHQNGLH